MAALLKFLNIFPFVTSSSFKGFPRYLFKLFFSIFSMKENDRVLCTCKDRRRGVGGERRERNLHQVGEGCVSSRQFSFRRGASHSAATPWHYPTGAGTEAPTTQAVALNKPDAHPLLSVEKQHEFLSRRDLPLTSHKTIVVFCEEERNDNQS